MPQACLQVERVVLGAVHGRSKVAVVVGHGMIQQRLQHLLALELESPVPALRPKLNPGLSHPPPMPSARSLLLPLPLLQ